MITSRELKKRIDSEDIMQEPTFGEVIEYAEMYGIGNFTTPTSELIKKVYEHIEKHG